MTDVEQQVRSYASGLDLGAPIDPIDIIGGSEAPLRRRTGRWGFVAAAAVLVVAVLGAALVALRDDATEQPAPTVDTTVVPQAWERIAEIDDAQPLAMAASERGVVLVGHGTWWSADGYVWDEGFVTDLVTISPVRPDLMADVIATDAGFLAVGTGYDNQPTIWRSEDGRAWDRVVDDDLLLATGSIPEGVSTPYGSISSVLATDDGFVAVGSVHASTVEGESLRAPDPRRPAIWTSEDGRDWERVEDLPDADGALVAVTVVDDELVALGSTADRSYAWRSAGGGWDAVGELEGIVTDLGSVDGALVAVGSTAADLQAVPTIWSSDDEGRSWTTVHEEPAASIATFSSLVEDGDLLLALGHTGPAALEVHGVLVSSTDGRSWSPAPVPEAPPPICGSPSSFPDSCPTTASYPQTATLAGGTLLLVTVDAEITAPPGTLPASSPQAGIHRALSTRPVEPAPEGVSAELEPPEGPVPSGGSLDTFVTVRNGTGAPIEVTGCGRPFRVVLANDQAQQLDVRILCLTFFEIPTGTSRWPVTILGSFNSCTSTLGTAGCGPLPPGTYTASVPPEGPFAPPPIQVEVR